MFGEQVVVGWLVLELTDSSLAVGAALGLQMLPMLLLGMIHLAMPAARRGRAGGAWVVAIGTAPLGQLQIGALASAIGVGAALGANGLALLAVTAGVAVLAPRLRKL